MSQVRASRPDWRTAVAISAGIAVMTMGFPGAMASAAPNQVAGPCPEAFPVADLAPGLVASGLTVETGNVADPFTATVIGVIDDGIAPGLDMIIAETDSPALQRAGGVWAGMSGSPVYAPDGRLIGAVAYGLSGGPSRIAGITPAAHMLELLTRAGPAVSPSEVVDLPAPLERQVVASGAATAAAAASGVRQLPIPLGVSGLNQARLDDIAERLESQFPGTHVYATGGGGGSTTGSPADIFAGSNFAAALSYGDFSAAGVGTTTAVCTVGTDDVAVAFGHPFTFAGATSLSTHTADAVFVQPDSLFGPFKVANLTGVVGSIDQDRLAGIRGPLGPTPAAVPVTSTLTSTDGGTSRSGTTQVNVQEFVPTGAALHLLSNLDRVFDRIGGGTTQIRWVITGSRASGAPFSVDVTNMYADQFDASIVSVFQSADQLFDIDTNRFEDARITGVSYSGSVSSTFTQYSLDSVRIRRPNGTLVAPPTDRPLQIPAGSRLNLRVRLVPFRNIGPVRDVDLSVVVPPDTAGGFGSVQVTGGPGFGSDTPPPANFNELLGQLRGVVPNNAVTADLRVDAFPPSGPITRQTRARALADKVVVGDSSFDIEVVAPLSARPAVVDGNVWRLRTTLSGGPATSTFAYGRSTDRQLMGDWDGNGSLTPAVFRDGTWFMRPADGFAPPSFTFGQAGDIPVAGDWDGDGRDSIGVYQGGRWRLRNSLSAGPADLDFAFGGANQQPVVGDWDGDGIDSIGVFRDGSWILRFTNTAGRPNARLLFGTSGDRPVVGEWDGDGRDEIGVYRGGQWYLRNTLSTGPSSSRFTFGGATSRPLVWG